MDQSELLALFDREMRIETHHPTVRIETSGSVVRHIIPDENFGFISYSKLPAETADEEIDAQVAYFRSIGMGFEWKVYDHDLPADLRQRLQQRGLIIEDPEALMVLDLDHAPEFYWKMPLPHIDNIVDAQGLEGIICMEEEVWGTDHAWMRTRMGNDLLNHPHLISMFAVPADGRVVSAAWMYYHPPAQFASLWGGSTLPGYRQRGYYTALLVVRAREARRRGVRFLMVDASPMSRPILEKHGFLFLGFSTPCNWKPEIP
jgi:hypothetical protein